MRRAERRKKRTRQPIVDSQEWEAINELERFLAHPPLCTPKLILDVTDTLFQFLKKRRNQKSALRRQENNALISSFVACLRRIRLSKSESSGMQELEIFADRVKMLLSSEGVSWPREMSSVYDRLVEVAHHVTPSGEAQHLEVVDDEQVISVNGEQQLLVEPLHCREIELLLQFAALIRDPTFDRPDLSRYFTCFAAANPFLCHSCGLRFPTSQDKELHIEQTHFAILASENPILRGRVPVVIARNTSWNSLENYLGVGSHREALDILRRDMVGERPTETSSVPVNRIRMEMEELFSGSVSSEFEIPEVAQVSQSVSPCSMLDKAACPFCHEQIEVEWDQTSGEWRSSGVRTIVITDEPVIGLWEDASSTECCWQSEGLERKARELGDRLEIEEGGEIGKYLRNSLKLANSFSVTVTAKIENSCPKIVPAHDECCSIVGL